MSATLMSDSGARRASEEAVCAIGEPEFTKTWHPVSHSKVISSLETAVKDAGIAVSNRQYSLGQEGLNMFGVWELDVQSNGVNWPWVSETPSTRNLPWASVPEATSLSVTTWPLPASSWSLKSTPAPSIW